MLDHTVYTALVLIFFVNFASGYLYFNVFSSINKPKFVTLHSSSGDNDFITNFVKRFLPTPEDVGLKRSRNVETYPCTKTEWAKLLPSDTASKDNELILIRQVLAQTNLEFRPMQCLYDANKHGWKAKIFHEKVDRMGPALVYCKSKSGNVFGGYNPTGWVNLGEYRGSIAAFLYQFPIEALSKSNVQTADRDFVRPYKLAKISGAGLAQIDDGCGPKFGMEGLTIALQMPNPKMVRSKLGLYYENLPDGSNSLFTNNAKQDELVELKVYTGVYDKGEKIPYSDALPFALN